MTLTEDQTIIQEYIDYIDKKDFPCVAARAASQRDQVTCKVVQSLACPVDDQGILDFIYGFVDQYRKSDSFFHSAAIIFKGPMIHHEEMFDKLFWLRLQALSDLDSKTYPYDTRVDVDPSSANFSFSLKSEAFFIIGLHPASSRLTRQFTYPVMVFNPHQQFAELRQDDRYQKMKNIIRKRDIAYSGSINPVLQDFGDASEIYQYSGFPHDKQWQCPLKINHEIIEYHRSA